jgi:hypothetical protein
MNHNQPSEDGTYNRFGVGHQQTVPALLYQLSISVDRDFVDGLDQVLALLIIFTRFSS